MVVTIVGGGFSGTMLAVHLACNSEQKLTINIIDREGLFARGIAYSPYSKNHLLNVKASKMSAFHRQPSHFTEWLKEHRSFIPDVNTGIHDTYMPRYIYGKYLDSIWTEIKNNNKLHHEICELKTDLREIHLNRQNVSVVLSNGDSIESDFCVVATGNMLPRNPQIRSVDFYRSSNYFQNPWDLRSVTNTTEDMPVLILGNGLTMVDTVTGLQEHGYTNTIYSLSPNGFGILPHETSGFTYNDFIEELPDKARLNEVIHLFFKHKSKLKKAGISAQSLIESLRPVTGKIWKGLSTQEKRFFMSRFRHLWGVARHRIPLQTYNEIEKLKSIGRLQVISGKVIDMEETSNGVKVTYRDRKSKEEKHIKVQRVINCTGPDSDIKCQPFLDKLLKEGRITQDDLNLGINTDTETYETISADKSNNERLFAMGSLLRGMLWESTAVNELRQQAEALSERIVERIKQSGYNE